MIFSPNDETAWPKTSFLKHIDDRQLKARRNLILLKCTFWQKKEFSFIIKYISNHHKIKVMKNDNLHSGMNPILSKQFSGTSC